MTKTDPAKRAPFGETARKFVFGTFMFMAGMVASAFNDEFRGSVVRPALLKICRVDGHDERAKDLRGEGLRAERRGDSSLAQAKFSESIALSEQSYRCWSEEAAYFLGTAYCKGGLGLPREPAKALEHLIFAKEKGHPKADMYLLQFWSACTSNGALLRET